VWRHSRSLVAHQTLQQVEWSPLLRLCCHSWEAHGRRRRHPPHRGNSTQALQREIPSRQSYTSGSSNLPQTRRLNCIWAQVPRETPGCERILTSCFFWNRRQQRLRVPCHEGSRLAGFGAGHDMTASRPQPVCPRSASVAKLHPTLVDPCHKTSPRLQRLQSNDLEREVDGSFDARHL